MSMFDRHPKPMVESTARFCSCMEETDIVMAGMMESLDPSKYHVNNWFESSCDQMDHVQAHMLLHYKDISPVFDRVGMVDDTKYVNDQPNGAIDELIKGQKDIIKEDEIKPEGLNLHWAIKSHNREKRKASQPEHVSSVHGGLSYLFPGDLVNPYYSEPIMLGYPTTSGLTEEEVYTLCTNAILNSTIARVCGPYFEQDITSALDFCVLGKRFHVRVDT